MDTITIIIPEWFEVFICIWIITYCLNYITSTDLYKVFKNELLGKKENEHIRNNKRK